MKYNFNSSIERYKVRFIIQEFYQVHENDYIEIFISIIRYKSLRIFLAITTMLEIILIQIDVIGKYLESALN